LGDVVGFDTRRPSLGGSVIGVVVAVASVALAGSSMWCARRGRDASRM